MPYFIWKWKKLVSNFGILVFLPLQTYEAITSPFSHQIVIQPDIPCLCVLYHFCAKIHLWILMVIAHKFAEAKRPKCQNFENNIFHFQMKWGISNRLHIAILYIAMIIVPEASSCSENIDASKLNTKKVRCSEWYALQPFIKDTYNAALTTTNNNHSMVWVHQVVHPTIVFQKIWFSTILFKSNMHVQI